jgi:hypothetical protein
MRGKVASGPKDVNEDTLREGAGKGSGDEVYWLLVL